MARAWAWSLGVLALTGLIAVGARSISAESHLTAPAAERDPACVEGPDYSAAVCNAATAGVDAPIATAGRDVSEPTATPMIASAETTPIPVPAKAPFQVASAAAPAAAATPAPGQRLSNEAVALAAAAERAGAASSTGFKRQLVSFTSAGVQFRRKLPMDTLAKRLGQAGDLGDRARLYIFAGGSESVVGYNITRDQGDISARGWSVERTAKVGSNQLGMAWRRGGLSVALVGAQRKFAEMGASVRDNLLSLRFSFIPSVHRGQTPSS